MDVADYPASAINKAPFIVPLPPYSGLARLASGLEESAELVSMSLKAIYLLENLYPDPVQQPVGGFSLNQTTFMFSLLALGDESLDSLVGEHYEESID